jgi:type I restriction enzyme S subunit
MVNIKNKRLPDGWQWVKLGELSIAGPSNGIFKQRHEFGRGVPIVNVYDLYRSLAVDLNAVERVEVSDKELRSYRIAPGDLFFCRSSLKREGIGWCCYVRDVPEPAVFDCHVMRVRLNPEKADSEFIAYYWRHPDVRKEVIKNSRTATMTTMNQEDLSNVDILLPPLAEQKRIAAIAQKADRLRRTRRYALQLSDTYLQSVFLEMFGDPVMNPKGWEVLPFGEVVKNQDSRRKPIKESERAKRPGVYPYYGAIGIIDYIDDFLFDETTLLVEEDGMNLVTRAKPIAFIAHGKYWVNNHAHIVSSNGTVNLNYLCGLLNIRDIGDFVTGIDQMKLTQENLDRIPIPVPPLLLQEKFAQIVQKFERLRTQQREGDRQAEHLFQTLLHRAFRGELTPQHANDEPASVLLEEIGAEQAKAEAEAKAATQAMGDAAEYLGTKAQQQDTEPIQLTLPGIE